MAKAKKGSQFEREISKYLTHWLTGQDKDYFFWRSPGSGSISTRTLLNDEIAGDIIPLKPEARVLCDICVIELKNGYPSASFEKWLKQTKADDELTKFWQQVCRESKKADKIPMLIFKKKGNHPIVGTTLVIDNLKSLTLNFLDLPPAIFYTMDEFFKTVTPEYLKNLNKKSIKIEWK